jgi:hypothetical protein
MKGTWLLAARILWLVVLVLSVWIMDLGVPLRYEQMRTVCAQETCREQMSASEAAELEQLGISLEAAAIYEIIISWFVALSCMAVALLIFWRRSADQIAFITSLLLLLFGSQNASPDFWILIAIQPILRWPYGFLNSAASVLLMLFLFLFPSGRFVPRWGWALVLLGGVSAIVTSPILLESPPDAPLLNLLFSTGWLQSILLLLAGLVAQVYRYRRLSTPVERQQTKWVVGGLAGFILINAVLFTYFLVFVENRDSPGVLIGFLFSTLLYLSFLLLPVSIAFAILYNRLWDIDLIIRKSLVYGVLTGILALVFFGGVTLLQRVVGGLTGTEDSPVAIVITTLLIAALFSPLRRSIQDFIDRRFYRKKYNAEQALEAFAETARNETDLEALTGKLVEVVQETMQPEQVSLWLRQGENRRS